MEVLPTIVVVQFGGSFLLGIVLYKCVEMKSTRISSLFD